MIISRISIHNKLIHVSMSIELTSYFTLVFLHNSSEKCTIDIRTWSWGGVNVGQQKYIILMLEYLIKGFYLSQRHSLILNQVEVNAIAKESVYRDESDSFSFLILNFYHLQCFFRVSHRIDLMIRQVFIIAWSWNKSHFEWFIQLSLY